MKSQSIEIKKGQEKSRKQFIRTCPSRGASMPKAWGDDAQAVGTQCPRLGQTLLIRISVD